MPCLTKRDARIILGKNGSGKTTLALQFFRNLQRCLILDNGFMEFPAKNFTDITELHNYLDLNGVAGEKFHAMYTPLKSQQAMLFRWALELGNEEETTLVLEECDRFPIIANAKAGIPDSTELWQHIMERGRHFGIHILAIGTHPSAVDIDLRRQATEIFTFHQHEPADIKWFSEVMPGEAISEVQKLGDYEYLRWIAKTGAIEKGKTVKGG